MCSGPSCHRWGRHARSHRASAWGQRDRMPVSNATEDSDWWAWVVWGAVVKEAEVASVSAVRAVLVQPVPGLAGPGLACTQARLLSFFSRTGRSSTRAWRAWARKWESDMWRRGSSGGQNHLRVGCKSTSGLPRMQLCNQPKEGRPCRPAMCRQTRTKSACTLGSTGQEEAEGKMRGPPSADATEQLKPAQGLAK